MNYKVVLNVETYVPITLNASGPNRASPRGHAILSTRTMAFLVHIFLAEALEAANMYAFDIEYDKAYGCDGFSPPLRPNDMWSHLEQAAAFKQSFTLHERELVASAVSMRIQPIRVAFREVSMIANAPPVGADELDVASSYRKSLAAELLSTCESMIPTIQTVMLPSQVTPEGKVQALGAQAVLLIVSWQSLLAHCRCFS